MHSSIQSAVPRQPAIDQTVSWHCRRNTVVNQIVNNEIFHAFLDLDFDYLQFRLFVGSRFVGITLILLGLEHFPTLKSLSNRLTLLSSNYLRILI